jgi:hypothetical protein
MPGGERKYEMKGRKRTRQTDVKSKLKKSRKICYFLTPAHDISSSSSSYSLPGSLMSAINLTHE